MHRVIIGLGALALPFTGALAQSNLTIYGVMDAGTQISRFGNGTQFNLASGQFEGSRIGVRGWEELGQGYKAMINLESRIELDTGGISNGYIAPNVGANLTRGLPAAVSRMLGPHLTPRVVVNPNAALFDRTSVVGLVTPVGAILMGRQYTPAYEVVSMADTFEAGTAAGWGQVLQGSGGFITSGVAIRASNAIQYRIESNGMGASLMAAFDNTGSLNLSKRFYGGNLRFKNETWNVGISYQQEQDQLGHSSLNTIVAGGSYAIGNAKLFGGYARLRNDHSAVVPVLMPMIGTTYANIVGNNARLDSHSVSVGTQYRLGRGRILAAISRTADKASQSKVTLYGLGYLHDLSKRTDVYTIVAYARNQENAQYALGGAGYAGGFTSGAGQSASALQFGIRHRW
jgi:GBP family porin